MRVDCSSSICRSAATARSASSSPISGKAWTGGSLRSTAARAGLPAPEDVAHNHRMRALFDAVVVGAETVRHDDPQLTVRLVQGRHPTRVVLDPRRRLKASHRMFTDGAAPTLAACARTSWPAASRASARPRWSASPPRLDGCAPPRFWICSPGAGCGACSSKAAASRCRASSPRGCLHRLQITIAPLIIGSGRPSVSAKDRALSEGLRPTVRKFDLGRDILFECRFDG